MIRVRERVPLPHRRWRKWRKRLRNVAIGLAIVAAIAALTLLPALQARRHLVAGRDRLKSAERALVAGDLETAGRTFREADEEFIAARASARNPLIRMYSPLPVLGRTPDVLAAISDVGESLAESGISITDGVSALPDGLGSLTPDNGRFPLAEIKRLTPVVADAAVLTESSLHELEGTAASLLPSPVADARAAAIGQLSVLSNHLADARTILEHAPSLLGEGRPKTYLFGAQNPAELRGTGGLIGVYSLLTIDGGELGFSSFRPDTTAPELPPQDVTPPNADYARIYDHFGGQGSWQNGNMTPDFPSAAVALENLWRAGGRGQVDGVILADPYALRAMLGATGPFDAKRLGVSLNQGNVVPFVTNEVYSRFANQYQRKVALGLVTQGIVSAFLAGTTSPDASLRALSQSLGGGHIEVYVNDPDLERAFSDLSVGGALDPGPGDFLALVQNSGSGTKIDYYLDRSVAYSVRLGAEGTASGAVDVQLENNAPMRGAPKYVLGPFPGVSARGENVSLVSLYCSELCSFASKTSTGDVSDKGGDFELGQPFTWDYVKIPSKEGASLHYSIAVQNAWDGDQFGGTYRFTFLNQPTIRPTDLRFEIQVPDGMQITSTNVPMRVSGGSAIWEGTPAKLFQLEISFRPAPLRRAWLFVWHVLTMPIIKL